MGALTKLLDSILFVFFWVNAVAVPFLEAQIVFPRHLYPDLLVDFKNWYVREFGDYLVTEKPHFFVGIVWLGIIFHLPLSVLALYGIATGKSWVKTVCLVCGTSIVTAMAAMLTEMMGSEKAPEKLIMMYSAFAGFAALAILRGLLPHSGKTTRVGKRPTAALNKKKRA